MAEDQLVEGRRYRLTCTREDGYSADYDALYVGEGLGPPSKPGARVPYRRFEDVRYHIKAMEIPEEAFVKYREWRAEPEEDEDGQTTLQG